MVETPAAGDILRAEFDHISRVSAPNNEDRARVTTFYLVTVASIIAAVLGLRVAGLSAAQQRRMTNSELRISSFEF